MSDVDMEWDVDREKLYFDPYPVIYSGETGTVWPTHRHHQRSVSAAHSGRRLQGRPDSKTLVLGLWSRGSRQTVSAVATPLPIRKTPQDVRRAAAAALVYNIRWQVQREHQRLGISPRPRDHFNAKAYYHGCHSPRTRQDSPRKDHDKRLIIDNGRHIIYLEQRGRRPRSALSEAGRH